MRKKTKRDLNHVTYQTAAGCSTPELFILNGEFNQLWIVPVNHDGLALSTAGLDRLGDDGLDPPNSGPGGPNPPSSVKIMI